MSNVTINQGLLEVHIAETFGDVKGFCTAASVAVYEYRGVQLLITATSEEYDKHDVVQPGVIDIDWHGASKLDRITKWKSTSADDLKSSLNCQVNNDPAGTAEDCLYALLHGDVKAKTHRKHIAAALRAASKQLEEASHD